MSDSPLGRIFITSVIGMFFILSFIAHAQTTRTIGSGGDYSTLKAAFDAVNAGSITGELVLNVIDNTTESATAALNASGSGAANYTSILIQPFGGTNRTISGAFTGHLINLNGADNVTIDGLNSGSNSLTISNTATGSSSAIRLIADATNNTIQNCSILGSSTHSQFGIIMISSGTVTGNDGNTFSNNDIGPAGSNLPVFGIYSVPASTTIGNDNITIHNNHIYDYFSAIDETAGIYSSTGNSTWTITNNRIFQTGERVFTTANQHYGIYISWGDGHTISGNIIGYENAEGTGMTKMVGNSVPLTGTFPSAYTVTGTPNNTRFTGIYLQSTTGANGAFSNIHNNTIAGFAIYTYNGTYHTRGMLCGIYTYGGNVNIGTTGGNTIGASTGQGSIYAVDYQGNGIVVGIATNSNYELNIKNNTIGAIDASGINAITSGGFKGMETVGNGTFTVTENTIGNATPNNIRTGYLYTGSQLSNSGTLTSTTFTNTYGMVGILASGYGTSSRVSNNIIRGWQTSNTKMAVNGITIWGSPLSVAVDSNSIGTASPGWITFTTASVNQNMRDVVGISIPQQGQATLVHSIQSNDIQGISQAAGSSNLHSYILHTAGGAAGNVTTISNNTFTNLSVNTTGTVRLFQVDYVVAYGSTQTVSGNSVVTGFTKNSASGALIMFGGGGISVAGGIINITNNNFSNITVAGTSTLSGFTGFNGSGTSNFNISGNTLSTWSGGTGAIIGLDFTAGGGNGADGNTLNDNIISSFSSAGAITGINLGTQGTKTTLSGNSIYSFASTGASEVYGIASAAPNNTVIKKNKIYDLSGSHSSTTVNGIRITAGLQHTVYNNIIGDLRATAASNLLAIAGISSTSSTALSNLYVYNNTVYLNASSSSGTFGTAGIYHQINTTATTAALDLRNNLVINTSTPKGTGKTAAFRRSSGTASTLANFSSLSNNNCYNAGTPGANNLIYWDGTSSAQTIAAYISGSFTAGAVSPRDGLSVSENPTWVSTTGTDANFLHISTSGATQIEGGGLPLSVVTDDFEGNSRNVSIPDIGADEFTGISNDLTGPGITFTALNNTSLTTNRTLTVTITDFTGVPTAGAGLPVLYWKINAGSYTSAQAVSLGGSSYSFTFGAGGNNGDAVSYYIIAQDSKETPNFSVYPLLGAAGFTSSPPAISTPPTTPLTYTIVIGLSGAMTVGSGGTYTTLTGAGGLFEAINAKPVTGDMTISIVSDISEDGTNSLNQWVEDGAGGYTLLIQPDGTILRTISASALASATPMININGADRVTIDGTSGKYLSFVNTNATPANTSATIQFTNGSVNDSIKNSILQNNGTSDTKGTIVFGSGTNTAVITNNNIGDATTGTTGRPANGLYSATSANTITVNSNNIYNWNTAGILFSSVSDGCSITGNSFYDSGAPSSSQTAVIIGTSNNHTISNNFIGGQSANCGGSVWTNSGAVTFSGIQLTVGLTTASSVQNNIIQNISLTNTGVVNFRGIYTLGGLLNIGTVSGNTIGHNSTSNSILNAGSATIKGIDVTGLGGATVSNNLIANMNASGTGLSVQVGGIYIGSSGTITISNNTVHDLTSLSTKTTSVDVFHNLNGTAALYGIVSASWSVGQSITENSVYALRSTSTASANTGVIGIGTDVNGSGSMVKNLIYDLTNTATGGTTGIAGIRISYGLWTVANNQISLINAANNNPVFMIGLMLGGPGYTSSFYYNSVYIGGSASTGSAISNGYFHGTVDSRLVLFNNILYNERSNTGSATGNKYVLNFVNIPAAYSLNNNLFVTSSASTVGYYVGVKSFSEWKTALSIDGNSLYDTPSNIPSANLFSDKASGNLSIDSTNASAWVIFSRGTYLSGQPDDFDHTGVRSTTLLGGATSIGSHEFGLPSTAPVAASASASPALNTTTTYTSVGKTTGSITWGGAGTVPSSIDLTYYPGVLLQGVTLTGNYAKGYWHIGNTGGSGFSYSLTLNYDAAMLNTVGSQTQLKIAKRDPAVNDGNWVTYASSTVDTTNKTVTLTGLTSFSDFMLYDGDSPLPLELTDFSANVRGRTITLKWETATEINTAEFEVERKTEGKKWTPLTSLQAAGVSNSPKSYFFLDSNLNSGKFSYRLKMIDVDGTFEYSDEVENSVALPGEFQLAQNYPNPFNPSTKIDFQLPVTGKVRLELFDVTGSLVAVLFEGLLEAGYHSTDVQAASLRLSSGMYIYRLRVTSQGKSPFMQTKKLLLLK